MASLWSGTLIGASRQAWKFVLSLISGVSGLATIMVTSTTVGTSASASVLHIVGWVIATLGLFGLLLWIRCPNCGCRLFWQHVRSHSASESLHQALWSPECPRCHVKAEQL